MAGDKKNFGASSAEFVTSEGAPCTEFRHRRKRKFKNQYENSCLLIVTLLDFDC